jgi:transcriptional regulator with XRE-family HTH domain
MAGGRTAGTPWPITEEWRQAVRDWLTRTKTERKELARRTGVGKSTITLLLSKKNPPASSVHVAKISKVTGVPIPEMTELDADIRRVLDWAMEEKARDPDGWERLVEVLTRKR